MTAERLGMQIAFLLEIDKLKHIYRSGYLLDQSRHDTDVDHSWHFAMMTLMLSEYANGPLDTFKVVKMALIHDIVEIDAGDVCIYDRKDPSACHKAEQAAAKRIFGMLPPDQAAELTALWEEFERRETPEAKFAVAIDRLDPVLHNYYTQGKAWRERGTTADEVLKVISHIGFASPELWELVRGLVEDGVEKGYLKPGNKAADK
jgi:putative hydrolase of HD superfamily